MLGLTLTNFNGLSTSFNILNQLEPIDLMEMDRVKLMNRTDTKFLFTEDQFDIVMREIMDQYRILEVNGERLNRYKTLYYDTANLNLYAEHHNGKLNRYKIRHRTYVESNAGFLEVKFKNNKGRTIKNRVKEQDVPFIWKSENELFLNKMQPYKPQSLLPTIWVNYNRCTLVHKTDPERLTIDLNLEFVRNEVTKKLERLVIAEVKQEKRKPSLFLKMMRKMHIREGAIKCQTRRTIRDWKALKKILAVLITIARDLNIGMKN